MKKPFIKSIPVLIAILVFVFLSVSYFYPALEGKNIMGHDNSSSIGMAKEIQSFQKSEGYNPLWTNSMFGGMPGYQISFGPKNFLMNSIGKLFYFLGRPFSFLFIYFIGFYFLLLSIRINTKLAIIGAIAFAFSSYSIIIIVVGHSSKAVAIGYLVGVIGSVLVAFKGKRLLGAILLAIFLGLQIKANHYQISYYGLIMIVILGITEFVYAMKEKRLSAFYKTIGFLVPATIIAVCMNLTSLWTTYEYAKQTIRGPSELTSDSKNKTSGLDKDYVVQWSYGIDETLTLLIPNFKGGGSQINPKVDSETYRVLQQRGGVQNLRQNVQSVSMYFGDQPGTSGPVYVGAIIVFLFVLGLFIVKGRYKWWLLSATVVSIVLSWGGNIMWLTNFLLDYLPLYNKFRAPSMILVIAQVAMPLLGIIALNDILRGAVDNKVWIRGLKWSVLIVGGILLPFIIIPGIFDDFTNASDLNRYPEWLMDSLISDRKSMLRADALRSLIFIILGVGILYFWHLKKIRTNLFIFLLGFLILADLWMVDKRYLNESHFKTKREISNPFPEALVDKEILKDKDLSYRVLPLQNPFQDARASFFHKNIGGYHAAKLRRYQELIEYHIVPELQLLTRGLNSLDQPNLIFSRLPVINMLNTRYFIYDLNRAPIRNNESLGNAWFVDDFLIVENADQEIAMMKKFNSKTTAIIDKRFEEFISNGTFSRDKNGSIVLTDYKPNHLKYSYKTVSEQLTVFSEIYYDKGWKAFIDGEEVSHFRVNYVLRAMVIPAGEHIIEFKFEPRSYYLGNKISFVSSIFLLLILIAYVVYEVRNWILPKKLHM